MKKKRVSTTAALIVGFSSLAFAHLLPGTASRSPQQFPVMNAIADKIIQKYQVSTCEQLWQERSAQKGQPKSPEQQQAIDLLRNDPQMRAAFINKVAAPIASKMFDCGMIP